MMLRQQQETRVDPPMRVYLKDSTFIPDFVHLKLSSQYLQLCNSDDDDDKNKSYHIQCVGLKDYSDMNIRSNKSVIISFKSTGRFELTCPENALMKCVVEVIDDIDDNEGYSNHHHHLEDELHADWGNVTYHLNKPKLSNPSLDEILNLDQLTSEDIYVPQHYPHADAQALLHQQRLVWSQQKLSTSNSSDDALSSLKMVDIEDEEEEKGEFLSQREKIRQFRQLQLQQQQQQQQQRLHEASNDSQFHHHDDSISNERNSQIQLQSHSSIPASVSTQSLLSTSSSTSSSTTSSSTSLSLPVPQPPPPPPSRPTTAFLLRYKEIISICDYDFNRRNIIIRVGAPIEFILDPSTPSHVEHVLEGRSVHLQLCFMSGILQLPYSGQFIFIPEIPGEIFVTCQIYTDMACRIVVINPPAPSLAPASAHVPTQSLSQLSSKYDAKKKIQQHTQIYSPRLPFSIKTPQSLNGSFPVAQRISKQQSSLQNDTLPPFSPNIQYSNRNIQQSPLPSNSSFPLSSSYLGVSEKLYLHSAGPLSVSSSYGDANSVASSVLDSDDGPDDDLYYFHSQSQTPLELQVSDTIDDQDSLSFADRISPNFLSTPRYPSLLNQVLSDIQPNIIVYVEDFKFQPSHLEIQVGQSVLFQSSGHASMQKLSCLGEFEGVPLHSSDNSSSSSYFLYTFTNVGTFQVKNEIFSFMACEIIVSDQNEFNDQSCPVDESQATTTTTTTTTATTLTPLKTFEGGDDEIWKFYRHMNAHQNSFSSNEGKFKPIPLVGSFSAVSPKENIRNDNLDHISPLKAAQNHLMACVDWAETEELSDEDENNDEKCNGDRYGNGNGNLNVNGDVNGNGGGSGLENDDIFLKNNFGGPPCNLSFMNADCPNNMIPLEKILISPIVEVEQSASLSKSETPPQEETELELPSSKKKIKRNKKKKKRKNKSKSGDIVDEEEEPEGLEQQIDSSTVVDRVDINPNIDESLPSLRSIVENNSHYCEHSPILVSLSTSFVPVVDEPLPPSQTPPPISFNLPTTQIPLDQHTSLSTSPQPPTSSPSPSPSPSTPPPPPPPPPSKKGNHLMNLLQSASAKKRSQQDQILPPKNTIDQLLFDRWKDIDSRHKNGDLDLLPNGKQVSIYRLKIDS